MNPFEKKFWRIGKKEWRSLFVLAVIIFLIILIPNLFELFMDYYHTSTQGQTRIPPSELSKFSGDSVNEYKNDKNDKPWKTWPDTLPFQFHFDPNKQDWEIWKKTGLADYKIHMIFHYLQKGGRFRKSEDLEKIYCVNNKDYERLKDHFIFPGSPKNYKSQANYSERNHRNAFAKDAYLGKVYPHNNYAGNNNPYRKMSNDFKRSNFHRKRHLYDENPFLGNIFDGGGKGFLNSYFGIFRKLALSSIYKVHNVLKGEGGKSLFRDSLHGGNLSLFGLDTIKIR